MSNNGFAVERDPLFNENNLIWMDLEMTGLEPQINRILEMAAVITDPQLNVIAEGPVVAIHQGCRDSLRHGLLEYRYTYSQRSC